MRTCSARALRMWEMTTDWVQTKHLRLYFGILGEQLEDVVRQLIETGEAKSCLLGGKLMTGVSTLPDLPKDATDRNRTSPLRILREINLNSVW